MKKCKSQSTAGRSITKRYILIQVQSSFARGWGIICASEPFHHPVKCLINIKMSNKSKIPKVKFNRNKIISHQVHWYPGWILVFGLQSPSGSLSHPVHSVSEFLDCMDLTFPVGTYLLYKINMESSRPCSNFVSQT